MKTIRMLVVCAAAISPAALAQKWEVGVGAGGGFYTSQDVTLNGSSASANLQTNFVGSVWLGNNGHGHWGGELRYEYGMGDLQLKSGGTTASFGAHTQQIHYDVHWNFAPSESRIRPYVAAGAGIKMYQGTGTEQIYQPLSQYALLTKQQDLTALVSAGAGIKVQLSEHLSLRVDVHDYLTPFPKKVITPNVGAKVGGWLQDFVPMVGLAYTF